MEKHCNDEVSNPNADPLDEQLEAPSDDTSWGWLRFRPRCLQRLASPKCFLFFISLFSLAQGMAVNSFVTIAIPSLEKQFHFSSLESGVIVSANDITALLLVCFVSFHGDYGHKTKWLGGGALLTGLGCLVFTLPYFIIGKTDTSMQSRRSYGLCSYNTTKNSGHDGCEEGVSSRAYLLVFVLSQLLSGAGTTPLHTVGTAYIDENVNPKYTALYIGLFYATVMLGPGLGNIIGGNLLGIFVDIKLPPDVVLSKKDPAWIGAWWLGPIFSGTLLFIVGIMLLGFPRYLPHSKERRKKVIAEGLINDKKQVSGNLKDIVPVTKTLLSNGTFMFQNMALTLSTLVGAGLGPFLFKIIRMRYGGTASVIGLAVGLILIPGAGGGIALGSFIVKRLGLKESCKKSAKVSFVLQLIGIWTALIFLIPGCQNALFAGVDRPYFNSTLGSGVAIGCNRPCNCSMSSYRPVCGPHGMNYFSPCFAGCTNVFKNMTYSHCSCLPSPSLSVKAGLCDKKCKNLIPFIIGAIVLSLFSFANAIPSKMVILRSVPDNQRGYALGLQFLFVRAFGSLIGPIVFGRMIDTTCTLWKTKCGVDGNCLNYDHVKMTKLLLATALPINGLRDRTNRKTHVKMTMLLLASALPINALSCLGYYLSWLCTKRQDNRVHHGDVVMDRIPQTNNNNASSSTHDKVNIDMNMK